MGMGLHYVGWYLLRREDRRWALLAYGGAWAISLILLAQGVSWWFLVSAGAFSVGPILALARPSRSPAIDWRLVGVVVLAPAISLTLNLIVMAGGYGWQVERIVELFRWRSAKGEVGTFSWELWFTRLGEHSIKDFTLTALIIAGVYLLSLPVLVLNRTGKETQEPQHRRLLPMAMLWLLPAFFQLFVLRGALWQHETWIRPLGPFLAIAVAMAILQVGSLAKRWRPAAKPAAIVVLTGLLVVQCMGGINYFYSIRWQNPAKVRMFEEIRQLVAPDKKLASLEGFIVDQHESKGAFIRPEIAWYLDRPIVQATSIEEIEEVRKEGATHYLLPLQVPQEQAMAFQRLAQYLQQRYRQVGYYPPQRGRRDRRDRFVEAGVAGYALFDLREPPR
jgi:hypothetical protein